MEYINTDTHQRTWLHITNPVTKRTLVLEPNESVELSKNEIENIENIENDLYLKPNTKKSHKKVEKTEPIEPVNVEIPTDTKE